MESSKLPNSAESYELLDKIGAGATSTVWAAKCTETSEEVAIKVIDLEHVNTNLEEIRNEIRVMSMSDHPNVVRYHCSFVTNSRYLWIVMPLMHGGSAMNIMQAAQQGGFEEEIIAYVLLQVLQALDYFHGSSLIHRDIKASNILVDQMGHVFLGDFGVSAALSATASSDDRRELRQTFVGTPCWMAPEVMEQMSGYDQRADIWSFGVTAIELALGKAPYDGYDPLKVLLLTLKEPPPTLEGQDPLHAKFSKQMHDVVNRCLQKDPTQRPSTGELLQMPFFVKAAEMQQVGLLVRILQKLPPLVERFKIIEARTQGRSGVWSVSKSELTTALANNNTPGDKISWDFETEPEHDQETVDAPEDEDPDDEHEVTLKAIPAELLMSEVPSNVVMSEHPNESCNASKLRTHDALDKAVSKGDLSGMLTWVEFPENQPLADRIQKANRLRAVGNLRHVNIPLVRASGISSTSGCVQLVCERVPSTTVNSYLLSEAPTGVDLNTARIWCTQVLDALVLLHSQTPPIVHHDLSCDTIYLYGAGQDVKTVKLCGLLLSLKTDDPVANGAFVAPEMYDDEHELDPAIDIYAFGLCLLQTLTGQQPYIECEKAHHLFKKVTDAQPPDALNLVTDRGAIELIEACLKKSEERPSAKELQDFKFLQARSVYVANATCKSRSGAKVNLSLTIAFGNNKHKEIAFDFDTERDTSLSIASEMVASVPQLQVGGAGLREEIKSHIDKCVAS